MEALEKIQLESIETGRDTHCAMAGHFFENLLGGESKAVTPITSWSPISSSCLGEDTLNRFITEEQIMSPDYNDREVAEISEKAQESKRGFLSTFKPRGTPHPRVGAPEPPSRSQSPGRQFSINYIHLLLTYLLNEAKIKDVPKVLHHKSDRINLSFCKSYFLSSK